MEVDTAPPQEEDKQESLPNDKPPPSPLPTGWILKESKGQADHYYYYNQETGESQWETPTTEAVVVKKKQPVVEKRKMESTTSNSKSSSSTSNKRPRKNQVRVLHILKKHKDSRKPSSWRQAQITITKEEARTELEGLLELLHDEQNDLTSLRATFSELARTESDCSSAKRGGDLGYFGPGKMQKPFEHASFALNVGELSGLVESNSGVHVILRIG